MKFTGIALAAGALLATLGATPAPATVTLVGTNLSFSQMHAACSDALGGVTFSSGHVRFISSSNGTASSDSAATGIETISFAGASGAAKRSKSAESPSARRPSVKSEGIAPPDSPSPRRTYATAAGSRTMRRAVEIAGSAPSLWQRPATHAMRAGHAACASHIRGRGAQPPSVPTTAKVAKSSGRRGMTTPAP